MTEFVALRPKLYSYKKLGDSEDKKCKGIKKCVVKKTLTSEDNKTCLFNDSTEYRSQLMFRSAKHEVHTIEVNKVALNRDVDKRSSSSLRTSITMSSEQQRAAIVYTRAAIVKAEQLLFILEQPLLRLSSHYL